MALLGVERAQAKAERRKWARVLWGRGRGLWEWNEVMVQEEKAGRRPGRQAKAT